MLIAVQEETEKKGGKKTPFFRYFCPYDFYGVLLACVPSSGAKKKGTPIEKARFRENDSCTGGKKNGQKRPIINGHILPIPIENFFAFFGSSTLVLQFWAHRSIGHFWPKILSENLGF